MSRCFEELVLSELAQSRQRMRAANHSVFRGFLSPECAAHLLGPIFEFPSRRVMKGRMDVGWTEYTPAPGSDLHQLFTDSRILTHVSGAAELGLIHPRPTVWVSCYEGTEHIDPHVDKAGDAQLLVCLEAPEPGSGGVLQFGEDASMGEVLLAPGDAVLFFAHSTVHSTTPLLPTPERPSPRRVVAVARYFRLELGGLGGAKA